MQVQSINKQNNSPNFGIKYVNPRNWNPNVLDELMKSDLVKQIDAKYPKAEVKYIESYLFCVVHDLIFKLNKKIKVRFIGKYDADLINRIRTTSLEDIEYDAFGREKDRKQFAEDVYKAAEESNAKLSDKTQEKETRKNIFGRFIK